MIDPICFFFILVPLFTTPEADLNLQDASFDHFVPAFHLSDSESGSHSFTLLGDGETSNLSQQMKVRRIKSTLYMLAFI